MAVHYRLVDGEYVSEEWGVVLDDMRADGLKFRVNEGHRTMARQAFFYSGFKRGLKGFALAAFPSPRAPHIRLGRIDHAIDFNNAAGVLNWLHRHGIRAGLPVKGEGWHVEVNAADLREYAVEHGKEDPTLRAGIVNRTGTRRLQKLLRGLNMKAPLNGRYDKATRAVVRRFQAKHGLPADAVVGAKTWAALRAASGGNA